MESSEGIRLPSRAGPAFPRYVRTYSLRAAAADRLNPLYKHHDGITAKQTNDMQELTPPPTWFPVVLGDLRAKPLIDTFGRHALRGEIQTIHEWGTSTSTAAMWGRRIGVGMTVPQLTPWDVEAVAATPRSSDLH